jgi:hypothetical protein
VETNSLCNAAGMLLHFQVGHPQEIQSVQVYKGMAGEVDEAVLPEKRLSLIPDECVPGKSFSRFQINWKEKSINGGVDYPLCFLNSPAPAFLHLCEFQSYPAFLLRTTNPFCFQ